MWSGKFMAGYGIKGYYVLMTGANKITAYYAVETQEKEISALKLPNFTAYNDTILAHFQIVEEANTKSNKYEYARLDWKKIPRKFEPTKGEWFQKTLYTRLLHVQ